MAFCCALPPLDCRAYASKFVNDGLCPAVLQAEGQWEAAAAKTHVSAGGRTARRSAWEQNDVFGSDNSADEGVASGARSKAGKPFHLSHMTMLKKRNGITDRIWRCKLWSHQSVVPFLLKTLVSIGAVDSLTVSKASKVYSARVLGCDSLSLCSRLLHIFGLGCVGVTRHAHIRSAQARTSLLARLSAAAVVILRRAVEANKGVEGPVTKLMVFQQGLNQ